MKTIGLIGGMSWESTVTYYQVINETVKNQLGGLHSAKCILYSVDFDEIKKYQSSGEWDKSANVLINNGIEVIVPNSADIEVVNSVIYGELCMGIISDQSK